MFYRTFIAGVVLFWLVMTGLLVRVEMFPDKGDLLPVPVAYVGRLIFLHQQPNMLVLYNPQRQRLGTVHLDPQRLRDPDSGGFTNVLRGTGDAMLTLPGLSNGRMTYTFQVQLSDAQQLQSFEWAATVHTPKNLQSADHREPAWGIKFDGRPPLNQFHYLVRRDDKVEKEASGTPEELLADPDLSVFGVDPHAIAEQVQARQAGLASQVAVTAHRGSIRFNGDAVDTFVLSARYADSLETTIHVSQLGQILMVKTFMGYDLYDDTLTLDP